MEPVRVPASLLVRTEVLRHVAPEVDRPQLATGVLAPAAVVPGAHDEVVDLRVVGLLEARVDLHRAEEVFLVEPPCHVEVRHRRVRQVRRRRVRLPEGVAVRVGDEVLPRRHLAVEIPLVDVAEGPEAQVPVVGVEGVELPGGVLLLRGLEPRGVLDAVREPEGAVVVEVVVQEEVSHRRPLRGALQRGVRIEERHRRRPARVRRAGDAHLPVRLGDVLHEPIGGVVGVGAFVGGLRVASIARRTLHQELPLGLEAAADVLEHEDVAVLAQLRDRRWRRRERRPREGRRRGCASRMIGRRSWRARGT